MNIHSPTLIDTLNLCKQAHGETNQLDKGGKTPYYWHLLRVMLRINSTHEDTLHVALLHDIIEDTNITMDNLKSLGYNQNILDSVFWCSKNMFPSLSFEKWMKKIGEEAPADAIIVKLADISDNLGFERMLSLMQGNISPRDKKEKNGYSQLQKIIHKNVKTGMKLHGDMGVYKRYYDGWNLLLENTDNIKYLKNVFTEDFCYLDQLIEISQWIPKNEMKDYLSLNNLNTWKIRGTLEEVYDKSNNKYLSLSVKHNDVLYAQDFLNEKINHEYIENQKTRDNHSYHITHINVMQYGSLIKRGVSLEHINSQIGKTFDFYVHGIGTVENEDKQTWFLILENQELNILREEAGINTHDFHVTLGFKNKDIHRVCKNKTTMIYDNNLIWSHIVENNFFINHTKKSLKY